MSTQPSTDVPADAAAVPIRIPQQPDRVTLTPSETSVPAASDTTDTATQTAAQETVTALPDAAQETVTATPGAAQETVTAVPLPPLAGRHRRSPRAALMLTGVLLLWAGSLTSGRLIVLPGWAHSVALFGHLLALAVAFGALAVIDLGGMRLLAGRRGVDATVRVIGAADPLVWLGFLGLLGTGALLSPDLTSPVTLAKLGAVLMAGLNGVHAHFLRRELSALAPGSTFADLRAGLKVRLLAAGALSQLAWWTAIIIGFWANRP